MGHVLLALALARWCWSRSDKFPCLPAVREEPESLYGTGFVIDPQNARLSQMSRKWVSQRFQSSVPPWTAPDL